MQLFTCLVYNTFLRISCKFSPWYPQIPVRDSKVKQTIKKSSICCFHRPRCCIPKSVLAWTKGVSCPFRIQSGLLSVLHYLFSHQSFCRFQFVFLSRFYHVFITFSKKNNFKKKIILYHILKHYFKCFLYSSIPFLAVS